MKRPADEARGDVVARVSVVRRRLGAESRPADSSTLDTSSDEVAVEAPLAIRISGEVVATTMRTPGHDRELALGYLFSEGAITSLSEVGAVSPCGQTGDPDYGNVIEFTPAPGVTLERDPLARLQRYALRTSACGVCGRDQILELLQRCAPLHHVALQVSGAQILQWAALLAVEQTAFARTGGLHAALAVNTETSSSFGFEDVGRHNAVDKVIGRLLLTSPLPAHRSVLFVTSRGSFEIVQKACAAGFPIVVCLSAPTSLAIEAASGFGLTLIGFVRDRGFNVYAGAERIL